MKPQGASDNETRLALLDREQWSREEKEWRRADARAEELARQTERDLRERLGGAIPGNAVLARLPWNGHPLAPQDPARTARFVEHLVAMTEEAVLDRGSLVVEAPGAVPPPDARETLTARACAACQGLCCRSGGTHAYLTAETLARLLEAHPDWTLTQVKDAYLNHLPAETTVNSCVFHAATGCTLPRILRSTTCNTFLCAKLTTLRSLLPGQNPPPVLALMFEEGRWIRAALLDEAGVEVVANAPPHAP